MVIRRYCSVHYCCASVIVNSEKLEIYMIYQISYDQYWWANKLKNTDKCIYYRADENYHLIDRLTCTTWLGSTLRYKITLFYKQAMDNINAARIVIWSENIMSIIIPSLSEVCHYWSRFIRLIPYMPGRISYHLIFHCHSKKRRLL